MELYPRWGVSCHTGRKDFMSGKRQGWVTTPPQQTPVTGICQTHGLPCVTCWALLNSPSQEEAGSG